MKKFAPLLIILAAILWSLDGLLRQNLYSLPPELVVFLEHLLGSLILLPIVFKKWKSWKNLSSRTWYSVGAIALFGGTLGTIAYTAALGNVQYISLSVVVLLQQLQPVFAIALAGILLKEKINKSFIGIACIALLAAYAVTFPNLQVNFDTGAYTIVAGLLAIVAAASWGASTVLGRYALSHMSFVSLSGLRFFLTTIITGAYLFSTGTIGRVAEVTTTQWWFLVAILFSTGLVALVIYYKGLSHVPARVSTLLELSWPLSALIIDWVYLGTRLSVTQWIGTVVLLFVMVHLSRTQWTTTQEEPVGPTL